MPSATFEANHNNNLVVLSEASNHRKIIAVSDNKFITKAGRPAEDLNEYQVV